MAEYIDREQLLELINENCKYKKPTNEYTRGCNDVCEWAIKTIENIPTADVVPKSEVERLEGDLIIERTRRENAVNSSLSKADGAREAIEEAISTLEEKCFLMVTSNGKYCLEKEDVMFWLRCVDYKLKKKYTENSNERT